MDLCFAKSVSQFSDGIEDRVVVGSLDLNQCRWLPDEIAGTKPEGIGVDFARAYLSNVCVAKELHRNGVGYKLIDKSKRVGITDMYVHVMVANEAAQRLYMKSGIEQETVEQRGKLDTSIDHNGSSSGSAYLLLPWS
ncbi:unnamed protein product [Arabidopsis lyrata]|uniref:Predicted protein n=1 Tax=Arabidopsis lyrata subsp. lyrata TaxID=81972 RepID=D7M4N2_ARALL|nr:predicted protein [Arabidopsis lyrata subsp. lyrata]CAH8272285.1 unnamed protein product [Arabidopsis lyrata]